MDNPQAVKSDSESIKNLSNGGSTYQRDRIINQLTGSSSVKSKPEDGPSSPKWPWIDGH
jgi:hypothetical protein